MKAILTVLIVLTLFALTNPDSTAHKAKVKENVHQALSKTMANIEQANSEGDKMQAAGAMLGATVGLQFADQLIDQYVQPENYYLFSITRVNTGEVDKRIGIGVLGKVYLYDNYFSKPAE